MILRHFLTVLILVGSLTSCNQNKIHSLENKVSILKLKNDSLQSILNEINKKYVFDSIFIRTMPSPENSFKKGSDYNMDIVLTAFNHSDHFIKFDSIVKDEMINPDTLKYDAGFYRYSTKLNKHKQKLSVDILIKNKYGRKFIGVLSDRLPVK